MIEDEQADAPVMRWTGIVLLGIAIILLIAIGAGFTAAHFDKGGVLTGKLLAALTVLTALIAVGGWGIYRLAVPTFQSTSGHPLTQSKAGRNTLLWTIAVAAGVTLGVVESILNSRFGPLTLTPTFAIATAIVALFAVDRIYRRNVDEMELNAGFEAGYWALGFYTLAMPVGWMLWKSGLLPEMPHWPIYWAVLVIYIAIFLWKRFR